MAYCRKCGAAIDDQAAFCPNCGVQQNEVVATNKIYDSGSIGWAVLAFLIPPVGFILWIAWMDVKPRCSNLSLSLIERFLYYARQGEHSNIIRAE